MSDVVLDSMGKPKNQVYQQFVREYQAMNKKLGKEQYLVPYLMSSHPGSTLGEAVKLAEYLRDLGYMPEQVQDFYPTPSTVSTCMYYTGLDPRTMEKVYVPVNPHEKAMQRALIQYRDPKNYDLVAEALKKSWAERPDRVWKKLSDSPKENGQKNIFSAGKVKREEKESKISNEKKAGELIFPVLLGRSGGIGRRAVVENTYHVL